MPTREFIIEMMVHYADVLFPFHVESLVEVLPHSGFIVAGEVAPQFGSRVVISGIIGTKGELKLQINTIAQYIGLRGSDPAQVAEEFDALEDLLLHKVGFASQASAKYYQMQFQAIIDSTTRTALADVQRHFSSLPILSELSTTVGHPVTNFGFRLVTPDVAPNATEWFDMRVEPDVLQPNQSYLVYLVYRSSNRLEIVGFARDITKTISKVLKVIEG